MISIYIYIERETPNTITYQYKRFSEKTNDLPSNLAEHKLVSDN